MSLPSPDNPLLSTSYNPVPGSGVNYLANQIDAYVIQTKADVGIGGFQLDYTGEETISFEADITSHFVEANTTVEDHIALKPLSFTIRGKTSELIVTAPQGFAGLLTSMQSGLSQVEAYIGKYTPGMVATMQKAITQAQNVVHEVDQDLQKVGNIMALFPNASPPRTHQAIAFNKLFACFLAQAPIKVTTPYGTLINMVIERVTMTQPENTQGESDVLVTVKQLRFVEISTVKDDGTFEARLAAQAQAQTNKGGPPGASVNESFAYQAANSPAVKAGIKKIIGVISN